jgi:hypothetical protein
MWRETQLELECGCRHRYLLLRENSVHRVQRPDRPSHLTLLGFTYPSHTS